MSATIVTLLEDGWAPRLPNLWHLDGQMAVIDPATPWDMHLVLDVVRARAAKTTWDQAALHYGGKGLETGTPSLEPARKVRKQLVRSGKYDQAKALDMVVSGGPLQDNASRESKRSRPPCAHCAGHLIHHCTATTTALG